METTVVEVMEHQIRVVEQFGHLNTDVIQEEAHELHFKVLNVCGMYPEGR